MLRPPSPKHPVLLPQSKLKKLWTLVQNMQFCCQKIHWWCRVFPVQNTQLVSTKHTVKIATSWSKAPCTVATKRIEDAVNAGPKHAVLVPKNTLKMPRLSSPKPMVGHHKAHWRCCDFSSKSPDFVTTKQIELLWILWTLVQNMQFCCWKIHLRCRVFPVQNTRLVSTKHTVKACDFLVQSTLYCCHKANWRCCKCWSKTCSSVAKNTEDAASSRSKTCSWSPQSTLKMLHLPSPKLPVLSLQSILKMLKTLVQNMQFCIITYLLLQISFVLTSFLGDRIDFV